ncbi:hypothetical protein PsorP6_010150 [Peronosclerospora sorghi]|uniref:Uncharacterized protein n=1 Tax=Peronosclerospora sorghi TaxID=230839 RepID=A0ACC0VWB8_9STRA|nr:hypothetical protein PsorP6_010150 [Peronosclerospora sorghi]
MTLKWLSGSRYRCQLHVSHFYGLHTQVPGQHCVRVLKLHSHDVYSTFSMVFLAFSPSLEFGCGVGVLIISMYLYYHPQAKMSPHEEVSPASNTEDDDSSTDIPSLQLKRVEQVRNDTS